MVHALSHSRFLTSLFIHFVFLYSPFPFLFLYSLYSSLFFFLAIFLTCFSLLFACLSLFLLLLTVNILGLFILPTMKSFTILPLNYFWPGVGVLPRPPTSLSVAQPSPLPYAGRATFHSQTKEFCFVFLLSVASYPDKGWVFSLTNSYDMHLVILAHLSLFWVVCHFSKTFPPKEFEQEPQNKLPPSPHC